jgi:hypothetical protein
MLLSIQKLISSLDYSTAHSKPPNIVYFRCVAWSPDGQLLIVGLGGSPVPGRGKQSKDGVFVVLNALTMEVFYAQ